MGQPLTSWPEPAAGKGPGVSDLIVGWPKDQSWPQSSDQLLLPLSPGLAWDLGYGGRPGR